MCSLFLFMRLDLNQSLKQFYPLLKLPRPPSLQARSKLCLSVWLMLGSVSHCSVSGAVSFPQLSSCCPHPQHHHKQCVTQHQLVLQQEGGQSKRPDPHVDHLAAALSLRPAGDVSSHLPPGGRWSVCNTPHVSFSHTKQVVWLCEKMNPVQVMGRVVGGEVRVSPPLCAKCI